MDPPMEVASDTENPEVELEIFRPTGSTQIGYDGTPATDYEFDVPDALLSELRFAFDPTGPCLFRARPKKASPIVSAFNGSGPPNDGDDDDPFKNIGLADVGGLEAQKEWLKLCVLKPLKDDSVSKAWGLPPPKGVLFHGPPGTGKTLLARAFGNDLSKELGRPVTFFHRRGGDLLSKWFGESGQLIRKLFQDAARMKPSIIFLDELDGLCPNRDGPNIGEAYASVVTSLLGQMDSLPAGDVLVIGATNRVDSVDPAMRRPGRFDKHLQFLPPDLEARKRIIRINTDKWKRSKPNGGFLNYLAKNTNGWSGADLEKLCREAFFTAFDRHVPDGNLDDTIDDLVITKEDWILALSKIKPTNCAVFGSTLYVPQLPAEEINPLVLIQQEVLMGLLQPLFPKWSSSTLFGATCSFVGTHDVSVSTFLIIDPCRSAHDESLEAYILPEFFAAANMPVYRVTKEAILSVYESTRGKLISDTIHQALNSLNPCIIFIPRIDHIIGDIPGAAMIFSHQLGRLLGKPVLVLATASSTNLGDKDMCTIFGKPNRSYAIQKPTPPKRKEFLKNLFRKAAMSVKGADSPACTPPDIKDRLDALVELAVQMTEGVPIETMIEFHGAVLRTCLKYVRLPDKTETLEALRVLLLEYGFEDLM